MIKGSIHQEDIVDLNVFASDNSTETKQFFLRTEKKNDKSTILVETSMLASHQLKVQVKGKSAKV